MSDEKKSGRSAFDHFFETHKTEQEIEDFAASFFTDKDPMPESADEESEKDETPFLFAPEKSVPAPTVPEESLPEPVQEPELSDEAAAFADTVTVPELPEPVAEEPTAQKDFKVNFDFENAYREPKKKHLIRRSGIRRSGVSSGLLYFFCILAVSAIVASTGWLWAVDVLGFSGSNEEVTVTVEENASLEDVAQMLYNNGLVKYRKLFRIYGDFSHAEDKISAGTYVLRRDYDYRALVNGMTARGGTRVEITVTIPEGYSLMDTVDLLVENQVCSKEELLDAAANFNFEYEFLSASTLGEQKRLEGFLFPDTYNFYVNDDASRVLNKLLSNFNDKWTMEYAERAAELGYDVHDIINIAAMLEKEAGSRAEFGDIASVIYNRLDANMPLGMDSTIVYITDETGEPFSTEIVSPYNTYMYIGLPKGPICNPGLLAIKAALYPNETNYYYFAADINHTSHFFVDFDTFSVFVNSDQYLGNGRD